MVVEEGRARKPVRFVRIAAVVTVSVVWFAFLAVLVYVRMPMEISGSLGSAYRDISEIGDSPRPIFYVVLEFVPWPLWTLTVIFFALFLLRLPARGWWGATYSLQRVVGLSLWAVVGVSVGSIWPQIAMGLAVGSVVGYDAGRTWDEIFSVDEWISLAAFLGAIVLTIVWAKPRSKRESAPL